MPADRSRKRVYVSSTFIDLKKHRAALKVALERAGFDVSSMESYPAFDERPLDYCLNDVASCDAYVLLLAHRYGYRPEVDGQRTLSITEREYRHAFAQNKPCFVFCVDDEYHWSPKHIDSPRSRNGRSLAAFRQRVAEAHGLRTFTDFKDLSLQVLVALQAHNWRTGLDRNEEASTCGYTRPVTQDFDLAIYTYANPSISSSAPARIATVFLHIQAESRRPAAEHLRESLEKQGFFVKRIILEEPQIRSDANVIYWNRDDDSEAGTIARVMKSLGLLNSVKVAGKFGVSEVSRVYEVWF